MRFAMALIVTLRIRYGGYYPDPRLQLIKRAASSRKVLPDYVGIYLSCTHISVTKQFLYSPSTHTRMLVFNEGGWLWFKIYPI